MRDLATLLYLRDVGGQKETGESERSKANITRGKKTKKSARGQRERAKGEHILCIYTHMSHRLLMLSVDRAYIYIDVWIYVRIYVCMYVCMYVYNMSHRLRMLSVDRAYTYIDVCTYVHTYVRIHIRTCYVLISPPSCKRMGEKKNCYITCLTLSSCSALIER